VGKSDGLSDGSTVGSVVGSAVGLIAIEGFALINPTLGVMEGLQDGYFKGLFDGSAV
jgi:hypothetical protein